MALYEIRRVTKRDKETGQRNLSYENSSWLGAIGYMSLLDMLGACFKPKNKPVKKGNDFVRALKYFSENLTDDDILALYAFRCALIHDFSLCHSPYKPEDRRYNPKLNHIFLIRIGGDDKVIKTPTIPWGGNCENRSEDNQTIVDIEKFGDIVEDICKKIVLLAKKNELELILSGGAEEIISCYTSSFKINAKLSFSDNSKIFKIKVKQ